ncbi:phage portal protein family protein, partial [Leeuwenhoekiella blandensis]
LHKIEVRPYNRTEQDIPNWRRAIQSAESQIPRRSLLYNLYADVDLDGHVEAVTGKRRDPIKAANWQFVDKEGTPVDTVNDLIDSVGFDDLLDEIMNAKFWGYSMMEPTFWQDQDGSWEMDAGLLPRLNYRPENGILSYDSYSEEGVNIREGIYAKTIMEVGKIKDLGLYMKASPYAILKRGGLGDYAVFVQTFGNPLIDAMWNGFDEKQRVQLQQALQEIGAGGTIIRPDGTTIDIKENNVNATGDAHGNFLRFLNAEISKALIGTTETTESSSSSGYAQSKTHQEQDESKHETDLNYVRRVLNSRFIRILQSAGFDTKGGRFIIQG